MTHDNVTDIDDAYIAAIWHSALNAYDHDGEGERDDEAAIADLGQSLATLRKQLGNAREALVKNQWELETIDRTQSTNYRRVKFLILANREALKGQP